MVQFFRTRPVEVPAVQWTGDNLTEMHTFAGSAFRYTPEPDTEDVAFVQVAPKTWVSLGEDRWVVRDDAGALHVHTPAEFTALYEEAPDAR